MYEGVKVKIFHEETYPQTPWIVAGSTYHSQVQLTLVS